MLLARFGMTNSGPDSADQIIERMLAVFDRRIEIPALQALVSALKATSSAANLVDAAIAIDAPKLSA